MLKYIVSTIGIAFLLMGCQSSDDMNKDATGSNNEYLEGQMQVKNESFKKYTQSSERGLSPYGYEEEFFSSAEQREIVQYVTQMEHVDSVYVDRGDDYVNIVVSVRQGPYDEIKKTIRRYIKENFPQRKIDIFVVQSTG